MNSLILFTNPPLRITDARLNLKSYRGQFVMCRDASKLPEGWEVSELSGWHLARNDLPVQQVFNKTGHVVGWCIGHPIGEWATAVIDDPSQIEAFYESTGGTFILVLFSRGAGEVYLDPYGCMPAVFSPEHGVVASTPTLVSGADEWDQEALSILGFPEQTQWFPFGMTPRKGVFRALPNHRLKLGDWSLERHWPASAHDLEIIEDTEMVARRIRATIATTLRLTARQRKLTFTLTAGRDSRMMMAAAKDLVADSDFFTFALKPQTRDTHVASLLAKTFGLKHRVIPAVFSTDQEIEDWFYRTGHALSGEIMKINKTLDQLDRNTILIQGIAGEVGRARYWKRTDTDNTTLQSADLLERLGLPDHPVLRQAADRWQASLPKLGAFATLDLLLIEQRKACWAAPARFGNITSVFEFTPFNDRRVFSDMMRLPHAYRRSQKLAEDICRQHWPELLTIPFNRFSGLWGIVDGAGKSTKQFIRDFF